jgi:hypothetical protein
MPPAAYLIREARVELDPDRVAKHALRRGLRQISQNAIREPIAPNLPRALAYVTPVGLAVLFFE